MKQFEFPIRENLKRAWSLFAHHAKYFLLLAVIMLVLNIASDENKYIHDIISFVAVLLSIFWSYVSISSALAVVEGRDGMLSFDALKLHFPSLRAYVTFIGLMIVLAIMVLAGLVMLVIPGIYFTIRFAFAQFVFVDKKGSIKESLRTSWRMVKGDIFWTVLLSMLVIILGAFLSVLLTPLIMFVIFPIAIIFMALLYRALKQYHSVALVEQPIEIAPSPELQS